MGNVSPIWLVFDVSGASTAITTGVFIATPRGGGEAGSGEGNGAAGDAAGAGSGAAGAAGATGVVCAFAAVASAAIAATHITPVIFIESPSP